MKDIFILGIESSCDETSMAIIKNGKECVSLTIATQMEIHAKYGGGVPEVASRMHTESITLVLEETLKKANMKIQDLDAIAVTYAPGLVGSLLIGIECAKTLSYLFDIPLIKVNHIAGHIYANNLTNPINYPSLALIVSGGHSDLVIMKKDYDFQVLGKTLDDAIGEAYDKVARVLGLNYPGGPNVEKLAKKGKNFYNLPIPLLDDDSYNFSFSGLKSSVINLVNNYKMKNIKINKSDLACSFQTVAIKSIIKKVELALKNYNLKNLIVAGGVSANSFLREELNNLVKKYDVNLSVPDIIYCTDNAAMIGAAAYPLFLKKEFSDFSLNPQSRLEIF